MTTLFPGVEVADTFIDEHVDRYVYLHQNPELSSQEFRTAEYIESRLTELKIENFRCGATGVVGVIRNGEGPTVAFRADTDGLPIREETGFSYASTQTGELPDGSTAPVMHGCGHDTHITSALALAQYLVTNPHAWAGTVVLIFQPAEETAAGAMAMIDDGLWNRAPRPAVVLAQHVLPFEAGKIVIREGHMASLADSWKVTVRGVGAHGSQPDQSIDPVVLAAYMVTRLQTVVSREVPSHTSVVVTVGTFHAGLKENIIPAEAVFSINVRTPEEETRTRVLAAIRRIILAEAEASGAPEPLIEEINRFPRCYNDPAQTRVVTQALQDAFGGDSVINAPLGAGSEDAGWLSDAIGVPGVYWAFGGFSPEKFADGRPPAVNHSPLFGPDPRLAITHGIAAALAGVLAYVGSVPATHPSA
ncbi:amidohydrolase [Lysinibacter sp. HNR]|uniref:amidohydrolase n=1 Tax=Lysinibacter sp. HNR TaxID=3031408 RepID=UPI002435CB07|nr:amidohydrolase [Lysinibacter sp. HNR]WGD37414.1 amidohydrolase [Lysinibacter sp. HNR]